MRNHIRAYWAQEGLLHTLWGTMRILSQLIGHHEEPFTANKAQWGTLHMYSLLDTMRKLASLMGHNDELFRAHWAK